MLRITIELWPRGDRTKAETIATMDLWNDGTGTVEEGNYLGQAVTYPSPWRPIERRGGLVVRHKRSDPLWDLVAKMLHSMRYDHAA